VGPGRVSARGPHHDQRGRRVSTTGAVAIRRRRIQPRTFEPRVELTVHNVHSRTTVTFLIGPVRVSIECDGLRPAQTISRLAANAVVVGSSPANHPRGGSHGMGTRSLRSPATRPAPVRTIRRQPAITQHRCDRPDRPRCPAVDLPGHALAQRASAGALTLQRLHFLITGRWCQTHADHDAESQLHAESRPPPSASRSGAPNSRSAMPGQ